MEKEEIEEVEVRERKGGFEPLDSYKMGLRWKALGKFVWEALVSASGIVVALFILVTCFSFWSGVVLQYPIISKQVSLMFFTVLIGIIILVIEKIRGLKLK